MYVDSGILPIALQVMAVPPEGLNSPASVAEDGPDVVHQFTLGLQQLAILQLHQNHTSCEGELCRFPLGNRFYALVLQEQQGLHPEVSPSDVASLLTARELQIATLVAMGLSNKQVSRRLNISEWTVCSHLRRTFVKLGVDTRAAMVFRCASILGEAVRCDQAQRKRQHHYP